MNVLETIWNVGYGMPIKKYKIIDSKEHVACGNIYNLKIMD